VSEQGNNPAQFSLTLNKPPDDVMDDISQSNIRKLKKMGDFRFQQYGDAFVGLLIDKCQVPSLDRIDAETGQPKVWQ